MAVTISHGGSSITVDLVLGWESTRKSLSHVHTVVNNPAGYVTLESDGPSIGTLPLFFTTRAAAFAAYSFLAGQGVYVFADSDRPETSLTFVREGALTIRQDEQRVIWYLDVGFRGVFA